jgi:DNA-binding response OmpR family regulator
VLLVEDDASVAGALRAVLTRRGWDVTTAGTVSEALERLARNPHCVVLDLMLPDGSGVDVLEHVRGSGPAVRVVVTTGANDALLLKQVRQFEPDAVLRKPIDLSELLEALGPCRREQP